MKIHILFPLFNSNPSMNGQSIKGQEIKVELARAKNNNNKRDEGGRGRGRGNGCFNCGKEGHFSRECT